MESKPLSAADILGNPAYRAISYGGYRDANHDIEPTIAQLQEDMLILHAMGIRILRTYKLHRPHAANVLAAIRELRQADPSFEMYVMLGAWIDCKNAWTDQAPNHEEESPRNATEIARAVELAKQYPDIVKVIAVGNEAMVKWATSYYVQPWVILKWVNYLQQLKTQGKLPVDLWITSSDNFASWGGGGEEYHVEDLNQLIRAVDFLSVHTYPMHDTHYNPSFWGIIEDEATWSKEAQIEAAMQRARAYAQMQYDSVVAYMKGLGVDKPVHIGETGWASASNGFYGPTGSFACDEFKQGLYHQYLREWTDSAGISCFYFEAFDEPWKDAANPGGSENHFGLFTVDGQAKYPIWDLVDQGIFDGLKRGGNAIRKTFDGDKGKLLETVLLPPRKAALTF
ncbi:MAG: glycosyl hydrolase family 17 [Bacteroidetes bacterium]|nr:MAG: glycosyl hydrolase family 17 [Bacteroidota bacterium]